MTRAAMVITLLLPLLPACREEAATPEQVAAQKCRTHYDILWRYVTSRAKVPATQRDLLEAAKIEGPDPWGNPYFIDTEGEIRVWSNGPDGEEDTEDDICYPPVE